MLFDRDKVSIDRTGTHHRGSVTLALLGPAKISIGWAVNVMSIHFPINAMRGLVIHPHINQHLAREICVEEWLKATPLETEHLFIWPAEVTLGWNAISHSMDYEGNLDLGQGCFSLHRGHVAEKGPWFLPADDDGPAVFTGGAIKMADWDAHQTDESLARQSEDAKTINPAVLSCVCIPSLGYTSLIWAASALQLQAPVASIRYLTVMQGYEVAVARQRLVDSVLQLDPRPEYLLFYGDDNLPVHSAFQMLMESMRSSGKKAVCGIYHMKTSLDPPQPLMWRSDRPGMLIAGTDYQIGDLVEVDGTGLDFALIKTEALAEMIDKIGRPLFRTGLEHIPGKGVMLHTEDSYFWERYVKVLGERPLVDTRCRVGHYDSMTGAIF